jgi:hypothetical protein
MKRRNHNLSWRIRGPEGVRIGKVGRPMRAFLESPQKRKQAVGFGHGDMRSWKMRKR